VVQRLAPFVKEIGEAERAFYFLHPIILLIASLFLGSPLNFVMKEHVTKSTYEDHEKQ
jgi:hypothetical protein